MQKLTGWREPTKRCTRSIVNHGDRGPQKGPIRLVAVGFLALDDATGTNKQQHKNLQHLIS